jgi:hypothetical protein
LNHNPQGHQAAVVSIVVQGDMLFSGSWDSSARIWTIARAVELKSFKSFDDGVLGCQVIPDGVIVGMSTRLIYFSAESGTISKIVDTKDLILGILIVQNSLLTAVKTIDSVTVIHSQVASECIITSNCLRDSLPISDSCSGFHIHAKQSIFWFGMMDGSILKYSVGDQVFSAFVSSGTELTLEL